MGTFPSALALMATTPRLYVGALGKVPIIDGSCGTHPNFLPKPFSLQSLSAKLREVLAESACTP